MNLTELFTPEIIAANYTEAASNAIPYLGSGLFPSVKRAGLDLAWIKGHKGLPVSLKPSAFDAKATFRDRIGVSKLETEMPFFREGYKIKEKDRQEILRAQSSNDPYAADVINRIYDDQQDLIAGADVVPERMRMQLLFPEGGAMGITIKANGVNYTYNYDPDGAWEKANYTALTTTDLWTAIATADPFKQIQTIKDKMASNYGVTLAYMVMNTTTFNLMKATDAVKNRWLTVTGRSMGYLTNDEAKDVIASTTGIQIVIYDKMYADESGASHKFVPDGYVSFIPEGALGKTAYGTTPEEADLAGSGKADVAIVNTGVAITVETTVHPVNVNTYASEIVLPSFERMDEVAVMKVTA